MKLTIRAARANLGLTRKDAAKLFDIHHETLANYEHDSTNVPISFYKKIESIYGIPTEMIFFGKEQDHYNKLKNYLEEKQHA
jgi:transcriptional regulator with XRE-family HTH domain